jgi:hypothetical protein
MRIQRKKVKWFGDEPENKKGWPEEKKTKSRIKKEERLVVVFVLRASRPGRSVPPFAPPHHHEKEKEKKRQKIRELEKKKGSRETSPRLSRERGERRR